MNVVDLPSSLIRSLPPEEQNLFIIFSLAANELSALVRVLTISSHQEHQGFIFEAFVHSQHLTLLKLYAGKIYEIWQLIQQRYFGTKLSMRYDRILPSDALADLKALKSYFGNGRNIISLLRNEGGFHYSRSDVANSLQRVETCKIFWSGRYFYNELYRFTDLVMLTHLFEQITENPRDAVSIVNEDVGVIGSLTHHFLKLLLEQMIISAIKESPDKCSWGEYEIPQQRKSKSAAIPIFFDPSEYDEDVVGWNKRVRGIVKRGRKSKQTKQPSYRSVKHLSDYAGIATR